MQTEEAGSRAADFVQSLDRGLAVIRAFDADHRELTLSEVARVTGLTRAAARRFLHTLVALGYMRTDGRLFALRPRVLEVGQSYLDALGVPAAALPHMEALSERLGENCSMSVLDGEEIVYVARVPSRQLMTITITVGTRLPAYATSMGRVLLAYQDREWLEEYLARVRPQPLTRFTVTDPGELAEVLATVRATGHCLVDQELEEGLRSVAVPVRNPSGAVVAAMNVSTHISRGEPESVRAAVLPPLEEAARRVTKDLAARF